MALSGVAGGLLGLLKLHLREPDTVDETAVDDLARSVLRLLGVPDDEADRIVATELPALRPW